MTRTVLPLNLLFLFLFSSFAFAKVDHVIVISIDGGKPASIAKSKMPILESIVRDGASTFQAQTILPSITLPSHTSMLTGVSPAVHKITWNNWVPSKGTVRVPTVFAVAKQAGNSTALFATKDKFKHLNAPSTLDTFSIAAGDAASVARLAANYLSTNKPNLLFVHFPDADYAGHSSGWESPEQLKSLEKVDAAIGVIKNAILNSLNGKTFTLIITGDHGGKGITHGSSAPYDMTIPWIVWGNVVKPGYQISKSVVTMDSAATALWLLEVPVPSTWEGSPVTEAFQ